MRRLRWTAALTSAALLLAAPAAGAAADDVSSGWWSSAAPVLGTTAPADQLLVQGGVSAASPLAYAAVAARLPAGSRATSLRLQAGDGSTPGATLALCPLTEPFVPSQGGAAADGPAYDCARTVTVGPDGTTYAFDLGALGGGAGEELAVAVVPTRPGDRVVLAPPGPDAVETTGGEEAPAFPEPEATGGAVPGGSSDAFGSVPASGSPSFHAPATELLGAADPGAGGGAPSILAEPRAAAVGYTAAESTPAPGTGPTAGRPGAMVLLAVVAAAALLLWRAAGRRPEPQSSPTAPNALATGDRVVDARSSSSPAATSSAPATR